MFFYICVWINGWVNNREAGDLRRYRAHYGVTVMCKLKSPHLVLLLPVMMLWHRDAFLGYWPFERGIDRSSLDSPHKGPVIRSLDISLISALTHWGRVTHICVSILTTIGSDNGFSPGRRQAIIWTNAGILLIGPLGTNFSEMLIEFYAFPFKKMHGKCRLENVDHFVSASIC